MLNLNRLLKNFFVAVICCVFALSYAVAGNAGKPLRASGTTASSVQPAVKPGNAVQQKPASLKIKNLSISPVSGGGAIPVIAIGAMVKFNFTIKNVGIGKVKPGTTYSLTGKVLSGSNPCPLASSTGPIPQLEPGASKPYTFIGVTGAKTGKYRLMVTTSLGSRARATYVDFKVPAATVTPKYKPQNVKTSKGFTDPASLKGFTPQPDPPGKVK